MAFKPPGVDDIEESSGFTPPSPDEFDISHIEVPSYQRDLMAGATPESFPITVPASLNPDYDIVRETKGNLPLALIGKAAGEIEKDLISPVATTVLTGLRRATAPQTELLTGERADLSQAEPGKPMLQLPRLTLQELESATPGERRAAGVGSGLAKAYESLTTPENIAMLPLAEAKPVQALFMSQMAASLPESLAALDAAKTPEEKTEAMTSLALTLGMTGTLAHSLNRTGVPNASRLQEAAEFHGYLRPQSVEGQGKVAAQESGARVQPPPREVAQEGEVSLSPEHHELAQPQLEKYNGVVVDAPESGRVMQADHETGQIQVNKADFEKWVNEDLKDLSPEEKAAAVKSAFEHEDIHLKTDPEDAEPFWNSMSPFEQWVIRRQYLKGATDETPRNLGFEAIRNRVERAMGLTRNDFVGLALRERWTAKSLDFLSDIVGKIRRLRDKELSTHQKSILDRVTENIKAAQNVIVGGPQYAEGPFMRREEQEPGGKVAEFLKRAPGETSHEDVVGMSDQEAQQYFDGIRKQGNAVQNDAVLAGMKLSPGDIPELTRLRDQMHQEGMRKLQENLSSGRNEMPVEFGKTIWLNGALEGAARKGPNYESVVTRRRGETPAMRRKGKAGEQEELFASPITKRGIPGEESTPLEERATAAQLGAKETAPEQKVFPKDLGFDQPGREMVVRPITATEAESPEQLGKFLTEGARSGGSHLPVSATKRLTALFDTKDGSVHLVSTYSGDNTVRMVDPEIAGKERNSRPVGELLHRYKPFASILLKEPRQGFHQKFLSMADYQAGFGDEAATLMREHGTGTEGIPKTSMGPAPDVEAEYPVDPGQEFTEGFQYPQEREPNLPRPTEQELRSFHDFFGDNPPTDATMFSRRIEKEAAKASRSMINGLRKLVDIEMGQNRGIDEAEAIGRVLDKLYENFNNSETRSDFIQRTLDQSSYGAPKEIPPGGPPPETGARELSTLRSRAPTTVGYGRSRKLSPTPPQGVTIRPVEMLPPEEGPAMRRQVEDVKGKLKDYLEKTSANISTAGSLSDQLYRLKTGEKADYDLALPVIKSALRVIPEADRATLLKYADEMQVLKNSNIKLTDAQQSMYQTFIKPLMDDNARMFKALQRSGIPVGESTYLGRVVQDTHSLYSKLWRGVKQRVTEGSLLGQGASFFKRRVFKALEDDKGNRQLIALVGDGKDARVIGYTNGKPELMGRMPPDSVEPRELSPQQQRTQRIVEARRLQILDRLDKEETALMKERERLSKQPGGDPRIADIDKRLSELQGEFITTEETYPSPVFDIPRYWKDKDGKSWRFTDATVGEIENNTNTRYYKEPVSGVITQNLKLKQIYRANQFLEDLRKSPDFQRISRSVNERNVPEDWRTVDLPQFRGLRIEPRTADVLDLFSQEQKGPSLPMKYVNDMTQFLRNSLFVWNPFVHEPNLLAHWFTSRGVDWVNPSAYPRMIKTGVEAFSDVLTRSRFRDRALREGAPLMRGMGQMNQEILNLLRQELDKDPSMATRVSKALGYVNPFRMIRAFGDSLTWGTNEILTLQLIRETMERSGMKLDEAIKEVGKHMPNYRIPPRVLNSRLIAHVMRNPMISLWGHYHYGALRSYGEMGKEIFAPGSRMQQRIDGLGRAATIGFLMAVVYPAIDELVNKVMSTKGLKMRRAGSTTVPQTILDVARGKKTPEAGLQSVVTPSPALTIPPEMWYNRNLRTGLPIYERRLGLQTAKDLAGYAASKVSPVEEAGKLFEGKKSGAEFGLGLAGISYTRADSAMSQFGRMADQWMKNSKDPSIREAYERRTQDVFSESDYQKLRSAVIRNDHRAGQMMIEKLLESRTPEEVAQRIQAWKDSPFTGTRKSDEALMAQMTPDQWDLWYEAAQERLDIANAMMMHLAESLGKK